MGLRDYLLTSSKTRSAKKNLEDIDKANLTNFLKKEFDKQISTVSNVNSIFTFMGTAATTHIENFANNLTSPKKMELFVQAVEDQAKSKGTKATGLFCRWIRNNIRHLADEDLPNNPVSQNILKKATVTFLLAKKDKDTIISGDDAEGLDENQRKEHRIKKASVIEKLQSKRLSNVLKVFMALVIWKYLESLTKRNAAASQATTTSTGGGDRPKTAPNYKDFMEGKFVFLQEASDIDKYLEICRDEGYKHLVTYKLVHPDVCQARTSVFESRYRILSIRKEKRSVAILEIYYFGEAGLMPENGYDENCYDLVLKFQEFVKNPTNENFNTLLTNNIVSKSNKSVLNDSSYARHVATLEKVKTIFKNAQEELEARKKTDNPTLELTLSEETKSEDNDGGQKDNVFVFDYPPKASQFNKFPFDRYPLRIVIGYDAFNSLERYPNIIVYLQDKKNDLYTNGDFLSHPQYKNFIHNLTTLPTKVAWIKKADEKLDSAMGSISSKRHGYFGFGIDKWSDYESVAKKLVKEIVQLLKSETQLPSAYIFIAEN